MQVLTYIKTIGRGFGKLRGQFDMPTWLCMLPDGEWGLHLCVVDSCNYRLQIITPGEGRVVKVRARVGVGVGLRVGFRIGFRIRTTPVEGRVIKVVSQPGARFAELSYTPTPGPDPTPGPTLSLTLTLPLALLYP